MNPTEKKTRDYFASNDIILAKIPEHKGKTPDFEGDEILVEVKEVALYEAEGLQPDSTYNAVKNNLKNAARQFRDYDSKHSKKHIVVIFSNEIIKDDIYSVWTGKFSPDIPKRIFHGGMILSPEHKRHIDVIVWFKRISDSAPKYVWTTNLTIQKYFSETVFRNGLESYYCYNPNSKCLVNRPKMIGG